MLFAIYLFIGLSFGSPQYVSCNELTDINEIGFFSSLLIVKLQEVIDALDLQKNYIKQKTDNYSNLSKRKRKKLKIDLKKLHSLIDSITEKQNSLLKRQIGVFNYTRILISAKDKKDPKLLTEARFTCDKYSKEIITLPDKTLEYQSIINSSFIQATIQINP